MTTNRPTATPELKRLLEQAQKDYETDLENLTDAATDDIETMLERGETDVRELIRDYASDASQLAADYYGQLRELWSQYAHLNMPDFDHTQLIDPDRVLWQVQGGFNNTDFNGLTYTQVKNGQARSGMTIEDLWPNLTNTDDAQQFIADMIASAGRLTMQRNIRLDPTNPRWARVCGGTKPCAFCVMLASRGFAYLSEETARLGGGFHNGHCHCTVVPSWGSDEQLLARQDQWETMYRQAVETAGKNNGYKDALAAMRRAYPDRLSDGVRETSRPWPDDVIRPYRAVWEHIFENHAPDATVPGKTHFPASWDADMIEWAVKETVVDPDIIIEGGDERRYLFKMIDDEVIRVWLQKSRKTKGRFAIHTSHPITQHERERIWRQIGNAKPPTGG